SILWVVTSPAFIPRSLCMPARPEQLIWHLRRLITPVESNQTPDDALLSHFVHHGDEQAFTTLVARHGPMLLGLCRRVLGNTHDAEDTFQATFLVLARKAASLRDPAALAAWLHGVAYRLASNARAGIHRPQPRV